MELLSRFVCQLTISFHTFLLHDPQYHKTMKKNEDFEGLVISLHSRGNSRFEHGSVIVHSIFACFTLSLSTSQIIHDQGKMLVLPNQLLY